MRALPAGDLSHGVRWTAPWNSSVDEQNLRIIVHLTDRPHFIEAFATINLVAAVDDHTTRWGGESINALR
jgi:hypothetical protein